MTPSEKCRLYHDLGELIKSGMTLTRAVEKLSKHSRGRTQAFLDRLSPRLLKGEPLSEALQNEPEIEPMEGALFSASEHAGRLERGFQMASEYYGALAEAKRRVLQKITYPLFVAHLAIVAFSIAGSIGRPEGLSGAGRSMLIGVVSLWGVILVASVIVSLVRRRAQQSVAFDRSVGLIPIIGGMRRALALSRFSAAYDMQLAAGVNVLGALTASGDASASANFRRATGDAVEMVRSGEPVSTALVSTRAFPERVIRAFAVGEETGRLEEELRKVSDEYRKIGLGKLDLLSEWIPKIIFLCVAVMIGWKVVSFYSGYVQNLGKLMGN